MLLVTSSLLILFNACWAHAAICKTQDEEAQRSAEQWYQKLETRNHGIGNTLCSGNADQLWSLCELALQHLYANSQSYELPPASDLQTKCVTREVRMQFEQTKQSDSTSQSVLLCPYLEIVSVQSGNSYAESSNTQAAYISGSEDDPTVYSKFTYFVYRDADCEQTVVSKSSNGVSVASSGGTVNLSSSGGDIFVAAFFQQNEE